MWGGGARLVSGARPRPPRPPAFPASPLELPPAWPLRALLPRAHLCKHPPASRENGPFVPSLAPVPRSRRQLRPRPGHCSLGLGAPATRLRADDPHLQPWRPCSCSGGRSRPGCSLGYAPGRSWTSNQDMRTGPPAVGFRAGRPSPCVALLRATRAVSPARTLRLPTWGGWPRACLQAVLLLGTGTARPAGRAGYPPWAHSIAPDQLLWLDTGDGPCGWVSGLWDRPCAVLPLQSRGWGRAGGSLPGPRVDPLGRLQVPRHPQHQAWPDEWMRLGSGRFCLGPTGCPQQGEPPEPCLLMLLETGSRDQGWLPPEAPGERPSHLSQPLRPRCSRACGRTFLLLWGSRSVGAGSTRELRTVSSQGH